MTDDAFNGDDTPGNDPAAPVEAAAPAPVTDAAPAAATDTPATPVPAADAPPVDPLAADKEALAAAQAKLDQDQAIHAQREADLKAAEDAHAAAHEALGRDQQLLAEAQAKLQADQAALEQAKAEHAATVEAAAAAQPAPAAAVPAEAHGHLDEMEQIALKWGGDIGTDLRNLVGKLRSLFGGTAA